MSAPSVRDVWLTLHRWFGVATALFLGFAAITGCILCFMRPIDAALNADLFTAPPVADAPPVAEVVDRFQAARPDLYVSSFPIHLGPGQTIPVRVRAAAGAPKLAYNQVFLARDGRLVGTRMIDGGWNRRGVMELIHDAHYTLLAGDPGKWFMAAIALGWMLSTVVGAYLTLPTRAPFWRSWSRIWRFSLKSRFAKLMLDVHRAVGLWLFVGLVALAATSVSLNLFYPVYQPVAEWLFPPQPSPFHTPAPYPKGVAGGSSFTRTVALAEARRAAVGEPWTIATAVYLPGRKLYGVTLTDDGRLNYHRLGPVYWYFADGRFVHAETPYGADRSLTVIRALYPLHSGRMAGLPGVALVFVLGLATLGFCVTGIYVWWKKRGPRLAARRARAAAAQAPAE